MVRNYKPYLKQGNKETIYLFFLEHVYLQNQGIHIMRLV